MNKMDEKVDKVWEFVDLFVRGKHKDAFLLEREMLGTNDSQAIMELGIKACLSCLEKMGKTSLLPDHFDQLSVYRQREELNKIQI